MPSPLNLLRLLITCLSLAFALPAAASGISKDDLDAQKELLQLKIDSGKDLLQKDIEAQGKRLDALDKRIDDQVSRVSDIGNAVDRFTAISGWIGILITVLLASGGLVGYFSVVAKARREAKETASNWFAENENTLRAKIDSLHANACNTINDTVQGVHNSAAEAKAVINRAQKEFGSTQTDTSSSPDNDNDAQALLRRTDELKAIPENSYSFDDWNTRAFAAYKAEQLEEAALYWGNAAKIPAAGAENSAQAIFNRAVTLGIMGKNEEEISLYDWLITTYVNDKSPALRELVASTMNSQGFTHLLAAKKNWTNRDQALDFLIRSEANLHACLARRPQWGMALGNLAYAEWLLGNPQAAEQSFRSALAAGEDGGEALLKGTHNDIAQHPIQEDAGFRELVDRLWAEYQANPPPNT